MALAAACRSEKESVAGLMTERSYDEARHKPTGFYVVDFRNRLKGFALAAHDW